MTAAGEYRTTQCAAHGHPEFTVRFARDVPVPGLERLLLGYFEGAVARGTSFKPGQTVVVYTPSKPVRVAAKPSAKVSTRGRPVAQSTPPVKLAMTAR